MTDPPGRLAGPDGTVALYPAGVALVALALEQATRQAARRDGGIPSGDLAYLRQVIRLAVDRAEGCAPATVGTPWRLDVPSSAATVTVEQAAAIRHVSPEAIRKAIRTGRLPARRHGRTYLLNEVQVRQLPPRRRRDGSNGGPAPVGDPGGSPNGQGDRPLRPRVGQSGSPG